MPDTDTPTASWTHRLDGTCCAKPAHAVTIARDFLGDYVATCRCGWSTEYAEHPTRLAAQAAYDRHLGATFGTSR